MERRPLVVEGETEQLVMVVEEAGKSKRDDAEGKWLHGSMKEIRRQQGKTGEGHFLTTKKIRGEKKIGFPRL